MKNMEPVLWPAVLFFSAPAAARYKRVFPIEGGSGGMEGRDSGIGGQQPAAGGLLQAGRYGPGGGGRPPPGRGDPGLPGAAGPYPTLSPGPGLLSPRRAAPPKPPP